jgi:hypothetical protein
MFNNKNEQDTFIIVLVYIDYCIIVLLYFIFQSGCSSRRPRVRWWYGILYCIFPFFYLYFVIFVYYKYNIFVLHYIFMFGLGFNVQCLMCFSLWFINFNQSIYLALTAADADADAAAILAAVEK